MTSAEYRLADTAASYWIYKCLRGPAGRDDLPRGLPLCRIRLTADDHTDLAGVVRRHLHPGQPAPSRLAALFCLFAAETLRRREQGGAWSWQTITDALGALDIPQHELRDLAEAGLVFWRRPLRRGARDDRLFLHSLLFEAGIPAALLARPEFGDFLRRTQRDLDRYGAATPEAVGALAAGNAYRLPSSWRHPDTIALAGDLLYALQPVRDALLKHGPGALTGPLAEWRDRLPLDLSEAAAERLVQSLLRQPKTVDRPLRELGKLCRRVLVRRGEAWRQCLAPVESGLLPRLIALGSPFSAKDRPDRVRLHVDGVPFAIVEYDGGERWVFRPAHSGLPALPFDIQAEARLVVDGQERERLALPGGEALDNLPWVFEPDEDAADRLLFLGQGSRSTAGDRLFVAVDPSRGAFELRSGTVAACGPLTGTSRTLHDVTGEALWRDAGERLAVRLRTGVAVADLPQITINGVAPRWTVLAGLVSLGPPQVAIAGKSQGYRLMWRARRSGQTWAPAPAKLPLGENDLVLAERDDVIDSRRVVVLPAGASVTVRPIQHGAEVHIRGLGEVAAALPEYPGAELVQRDADATVLRAHFDGLPPANVLVDTRLADGLDLRHRLRVPLAHGGFLGGDGRVLPPNASVTFPDLGRMVARGGAGDDRAELAAYLTVVAGRLQGVRLARTLAFLDELPLARLQPELRRLYATSGERDAEIRLNVRRNGLDGPGVRAGAFDVALVFNKGAARAEICDRAGQRVERPGELAALGLAHPEVPATQLPRDAAGGWELPGMDRPGPWLIVGVEGLTSRVRPSIWPGAAPAESPQGELAAAAAIGAQDDRNAAYAAALRALAEAPVSDRAVREWLFLDATLAAATAHAPAIFFDALVRAVECPLLLVHWLLRADPAQLARLAALEDELPFAWCLVPLAAWREAVLATATHYRGFGIEPSTLFASRLEDIAALCPPAMAGVWEAREALGLPHGQNQVGRDRLAALVRPFESFCGPSPDEKAWHTVVATSKDWENLPAEVRAGAAHIAARAAVTGTALPPRAVSAIRFCRHDAPDAFDSHFLFAVLLRLARHAA